MEIRSFRAYDGVLVIEIGESPDFVELVITENVKINIWGEPSRDELLRGMGIAVLSGTLRNHERDKLCTSIERVTTTN